MSGTTCTANCAYPSVGQVPQLFATLINTILATQCGLAPLSDLPRDYGQVAVEKSSEEFDFVVIGSAAGSVVASRLSENPDWNVLLVEAGGDPPVESQLSSMWVSMVGTEYDWKYSENASRACQDTNGVCKVAAGKMLGGSTSLNGMVYSRGNRHTYNEWAKKYGNPGWSYNDVLPYFKKAEHNLDKAIYSGHLGEKYHGTKGPIKVGYMEKMPSDLQIYVDAAVERNIPRNPDSNGECQIGVGALQFMAYKNRRQSTYVSYIIPAKNRPNLFIMKHSMATKILINDIRATGVQIMYKNQHKFTAIAKKEIIVSAGAIGSPKLLMLSGIGSPKKLQPFKIPVKKSLPVGENLMDHVNTFLLFKVQNITNPKPTDSIDAVYQLVANNTGPLAQSYLEIAFLNTNKTKSYPNYEVQYVVSGRGTDLPDGLAKIFDYQFNTTLLQPVLDINKNHDLLAMYLYFLRPKSSGSVSLKSNSPNDKPHIESNYFANHNDMEKIVAAIKEQTRFTETAAFRAKHAELVEIPLPKCAKYKFKSDQYWKCYVTQLSASGSHQCCSNKMGPEYDPTTVVDSELRVHGIENLRVIDSSIFPKIPTGHLTAPTIMVAEKGSDLVKMHWRKR